VRLTRRAWFQRILGAGLALRTSLGSGLGLGVDDLLNRNRPPFTIDRKRTYRADVVITFLGVPIFSRQGVGGAFAVLREASQEQRRLISLQFAGGANPERTHGIHYFGSIEEVILESRGEQVQAGCFGFVTARPANQDGFEQARQRLMSSNSHPAQSVIAVEEQVQQGRLKKTSAILPVGDFAWRNWPELVKQVRSGFQQCDAARQEVNFPAKASTFLFAVLCAARASGRGSFYCLHNAKPYRLECEKVPDGHMGASFAAKGLAPRAQTVEKLTGQIHDLTKGRTSTFRLWLDESSELPIRIEFSPRPYLRIALELDPALEPSKRKEKACREPNSIFFGARGQV
jgi:hypothetical protein